MEEKVVIELTWDEYKTLMSAIQIPKDMIDSIALDELYQKLYLSRKVIKHRYLVLCFFLLYSFY